MGAKKILSEYRWKGGFLMSSGKRVIIEIILLKLETDKPEFPQGYKFKWIAFNRDNSNEKVLFDNHIGKSPHYHVNGKETFFAWKSRWHTQQLFYQKVIQKFGNFIQKLR